MCVNPGYSGQKFNKKVLDKIKKIKKYCNQKNLNNFFEMVLTEGLIIQISRFALKRVQMYLYLVHQFFGMVMLNLI